MKRWWCSPIAQGLLPTMVYLGLVAAAVGLCWLLIRAGGFVR